MFILSVGRIKRVDSCMVDTIRKINHTTDFDTLGSCCGHGKYLKTVVVKNPKGTIMEYFSGKRIPRIKRFYKKDKEGYYYIPEVENEI